WSPRTPPPWPGNAGHPSTTPRAIRWARWRARHAWPPTRAPDPHAAGSGRVESSPMRPLALLLVMPLTLVAMAPGAAVARTPAPVPAPTPAGTLAARSRLDPRLVLATLPGAEP